MKHIFFISLMIVFLVSCGTTENNNDVDPRITTCENASTDTQSKLTQANKDPNVQLEFLGTEPILGTVSSCFLKVKISNPNDPSQPASYNLFDLVRGKTASKHSSLEEMDAEVENLKNAVQVGDIQIEGVEVTVE